MSDVLRWEADLDDVDPAVRDRALQELIRLRAGDGAGTGGNVNMHMHSFFSYNAEGWSPSHLAWAGHEAGLYAAGLCDFDVLDGLEEFLDATDDVGLRACVSLETRAWFGEYAHADISSPGEPGVTYIMGGGFFRLPPPGTAAETGLRDLRERAQERNRAMMDRLRAALPDLDLDYERDVMALTPSGNPTERHIVAACVNRAMGVFQHPEPTATFWAGVLQRGAEDVLLLMADRPAFEEVVRARLMKRGGLCYVQPGPDAFPTVDAFVRWVESCEAIPMVTWLDGTSEGEADPRAMLECLVGKGCTALNIIPDRNWNLPEGPARDRKRANLRAIVQLADAMHLPVNIGTEMNKLGLPFVDDLDGEVLREYREVFRRGAEVMVGHTRLARYAAAPYGGERARAQFPDPAARNRFYATVGSLPPLSAAESESLLDQGAEGAWSWFADMAARMAEA